MPRIVFYLLVAAIELVGSVQILYVLGQDNGLAFSLAPEAALIGLGTWAIASPPKYVRSTSQGA